MVGCILSCLTFNLSLYVFMGRYVYVCMYVAWGLDVKHPRFLALCIRRTPDLRGCVICKNMRFIHAKYGI